MSEGDTIPLRGSADMWRSRAKAAEAENARLHAEVARLREALEKIERWHGEFPPTGQFWDLTTKLRPVSYGAAYGSNGERDFMRSIARAALEESK